MAAQEWRRPLPSVVATTSPSECRNDIEGEVCADDAAIGILERFITATSPTGAGGSACQGCENILPTGGSRQAAVVRKAAERFGCKSESCVLDAIVMAVPPKERIIIRQQALRFKPPGPRDGPALLTNIDIDTTLRQWAEYEFHDFFPFSFAMIDFAKTKDHLAAVDLRSVRKGVEPVRLNSGRAVRRPCLRMACVINTDVSTAGGIHWMCVFVDTSAPPGSETPWSVEFFDSTGDAPAETIIEWMENSRKDLVACRRGACGDTRRDDDSLVATATPARTRRHQHGNTECGVYALYYIRQRLERVPFGFFSRGRISDADMERFRPHLFSRVAIGR